MTPLEQLMSLLDEVVPDDSPPLWVRAVGEAGDLNIGLQADMNAMLGWVAPPQCWAVGVVAGGWAYHTDGTANRSLRDAERARIRITCVMDRHGGLQSRVGFDHREPLEEPPDSGRLVDGMRRCLGLPTDPPQARSDEFLALLWLGEVIAEGRARRDHLSWPEVAALHPAVRALHDDGHDLAAEHLELVLRVAGKAWSWDRLRLLATEGGWIGDLVPPELAGWMDVGMFSRWLLDGYRSLDELMVDARSLLVPSTARRLRQSLRAVGIVVGAA